MKNAKLAMRELTKKLRLSWKKFLLLTFSTGTRGSRERVINPCDINAIKADKMRKALEDDNEG
jgi:hypothetical protein